MIGQSLLIRGISKSYDTTCAVRETDLEIGAGEFVSIVGPSGSGKTTLLTMIAGFEKPTAGSVIVGNNDITGLAPHRRNIGMVFQKYALFPHMTVRKNVAFPLRMRQRPSNEDLDKRVDAMLDMIQLTALGHRYPHQLSGGQQQRVAVGRALVFDPPVLLMDEPLGALDKKLREAMQMEIKRLQHRLGATIVYVTHDQDEALTLSDRVAVMNKGRIEQIGSPVQLYTEPHSAFVADFVGTINFIPGVCAGHEPGLAVVRTDGGAFIKVGLANRATPCELPIRTPVIVAIRPEHMLLDPANDAQNTLPAIFENLVFSGANRTAYVRLAGTEGPSLRIQVPEQFIDPPGHGDHVQVALPPGKMKLFHAEDGRLL